MLLPKKNRSRQEIICDVLESAKEPTPKSHLLSKAHISWHIIVTFVTAAAVLV